MATKSTPSQAPAHERWTPYRLALTAPYQRLSSGAGRVVWEAFAARNLHGHLSSSLAALQAAGVGTWARPAVLRLYLAELEREALVTVDGGGIHLRNVEPMEPGLELAERTCFFGPTRAEWEAIKKAHGTDLKTGASWVDGGGAVDLPGGATLALTWSRCGSTVVPVWSQCVAGVTPAPNDSASFRPPLKEKKKDQDHTLPAGAGAHTRVNAQEPGVAGVPEEPIAPPPEASPAEPLQAAPPQLPPRTPPPRGGPPEDLPPALPAPPRPERVPEAVWTAYVELHSTARAAGHPVGWTWGESEALEAVAMQLRELAEPVLLRAIEDLAIKIAGGAVDGTLRNIGRVLPGYVNPARTAVRREVKRDEQNARGNAARQGRPGAVPGHGRGAGLVERDGDPRWDEPADVRHLAGEVLASFEAPPGPGPGSA